MKQYEAMLDSLDRTKTVLAIFPSPFIQAGLNEVHYLLTYLLTDCVLLLLIILLSVVFNLH